MNTIPAMVTGNTRHGHREYQTWSQGTLLQQAETCPFRDIGGAAWTDMALVSCSQDILGRTKLIDTGKVHAFVELHIEQGPELETKVMRAPQLNPKPWRSLWVSACPPAVIAPQQHDLARAC